MEVVVERFAEDGIRIGLPFLNAGSTDDYPSPFPGIRPNNVGTNRAVCGPPAFLQIANELGCRICKEAVWHRDQCNWVGAEPAPVGSYNDSPLYRALGPTLYSGTSGVALFLSELNAVSPSQIFRRTALGAMRHGLNHAPAGQSGFYTGTLGIALAAARVGCVLGDDELLNGASRLVENLVKSDPPGESDFLAGASGALVAILLLRKMLNGDALLPVAIGLGNHLLQSADRSPHGYSWASSRLRYRHNLTGLSHGASGVAYALLELFHATEDTRYACS